MVPLPDDWGNRTLQQKLDSVYELLISSKTTEFVLRKEARESRVKWYGPKVAAEDAITALREATERLEKTTELMKKAKLKFLRRLTGTWGLPEKVEGSNLYPLLFKTIVKRAGGKFSQKNSLLKKAKMIHSDMANQV